VLAPSSATSLRELEERTKDRERSVAIVVASVRAQARADDKWSSFLSVATSIANWIAIASVIVSLASIAKALTRIASRAVFRKLPAKLQKRIEALIEKRKRRKSSGGSGEPEPPFDPKGTVGAARHWTVARRLEHAGLPAEGLYAFRPRRNYHPSQPLPRGDRGGFLDEFGNEWRKARKPGSRGDEWHWDVTFGRRPPTHFRAASKSGKHINVTPDGRIHH